MAMTASPPAGWYVDPSRSHEYRYWDGTAWTFQVSDGGRVSTEVHEPPVSTPAEPRSPHRAEPATDDASASDLVDRALAVIESNVTILADGATRIFGGSESPVMDAAKLLAEAVELRPDDPSLHFAWVSALATAAQWKEARTRMEELCAARPEFLPARFAVEGWEHWTPVFLLPPWTPTTTDPHQRIRAFVKGRVLIATRDRITPRATFFLRDVNSELDATRLRDARIDVATVLSPVATSPQVVALYFRVWDDPSDPYVIESVATPFRPRGAPDRAGYEYLCAQHDLDIVFLAPDDRVLLNRRVRLPERQRAEHRDLLAKLTADGGSAISMAQAVEACQLHSSRYDLHLVPFEEAEPV